MSEEIHFATAEPPKAMEDGETVRERAGEPEPEHGKPTWEHWLEPAPPTTRHELPSQER
jgi:hypothetical protein